MKRTLFIALLVSLTSHLYAQEERIVTKEKASSPEKAPVRAEAAETKQGNLHELNLTPEQKSSIRVINQSHRTARQEVENDASLSAEQKATKLRALKKDHALEVEKLLTDEQKVKFRERRQKRKLKE